MRKKTHFVIGVDIGGGSLRCGLVSNRGRIRRGSALKVPVDSKGGRESILETFVSPLRENFRQAATEGLEVFGLGIGMCGPLDYSEGICLIRGVDKYEWHYGTNLKDGFRCRLGLPDDFPIIFEIDAWAFALGETWLGAGTGFR